MGNEDHNKSYNRATSGLMIAMGLAWGVYTLAPDFNMTWWAWVKIAGLGIWILFWIAVMAAGL